MHAHICIHLHTELPIFFSSFTQNTQQASAHKQPVEGGETATAEIYGSASWPFGLWETTQIGAIISYSLKGWIGKEGSAVLLIIIDTSHRHVCCYVIVCVLYVCVAPLLPFILKGSVKKIFSSRQGGCLTLLFSFCTIDKQLDKLLSFYLSTIIYWTWN